MMNQTSEESTLSRRAFKALQPPLPYLASFFKCLGDPCHHQHNKSGRIALCVAENKLLNSHLSQRLLQSPSQHHTNNSSSLSVAQLMFQDSNVFNYNDFKGLPPVRLAIAQFLYKYFVSTGNDTKSFVGEKVPESSSSSVAVEIKTTTTTIIEEMSQQIIIGSGAAGLLNILFFSLCEQGDVVLIPAPYYAAFESDMKNIAGCIPYAVHSSNPVKGPDIDDLEQSVEKVNTSGKRVRMLLLTNPHNPLGTIYSPDMILRYIGWARSKHIHTIVDEIYALSVHNPETHEFQSVSKILNNHLGNDVHMLWAMSKDFGCSGLRFGVLYTQNEEMIRVSANLNVFSGVSQPIQSMVAHLLSDNMFVDELLETSRSMLRLSCSIVTNALDEMGIPYVTPQAAIFIYCDFSSWLPSCTFDGEAILAEFFEGALGIVMTPGHSQNENRPGMFRICYAWVTPEVLQIGMGRLKFLSKFLEEDGWEGMRDKIRADHDGIIPEKIVAEMFEHSLNP